MRRKRVLLVGTLMLIALAFSAQAITFDSDIVEPQKSTREGEPATYTMLVRHDSNKPETFDLYSPDVEWGVDTDVLRPFTVNPGETKQIKIEVTPLYATPGYYAITIHTRHAGSGLVNKDPIIIGVQSKDYVPGQYVPALTISPEISQKADPRQPIKITVGINNRNPRSHEGVQLKIRSELINAEQTVSINGLEKKQVTFEAELPAITAPQKDILRVTALVKDGEKIIPFGAEPIRFEIIEYGDIEHTVETKKSFLKTKWEYTLKNTGNTKKDKVFTLRSSFFQSWFSTFEPSSKKLENQDGTFAAWDVKLDVGESTAIKVTTNYRPLLLVIIVILAAVGSYYFFRNPLVVRKSAVVISADEGGMSELKVLIEVSNRTRKPVKSLEVLDKVPHIASVVREFEVGTIRPVKIAHTEKKGTLIKWVLDELDGSEERVITYRIRSKLSILGQMRLPIAVTKFSTMSGRQRSTKSNISQIGFGQ